MHQSSAQKILSDTFLLIHIVLNLRILNFYGTLRIQMTLRRNTASPLIKEIDIEHIGKAKVICISVYDTYSCIRLQQTKLKLKRLKRFSPADALIARTVSVEPTNRGLQGRSSHS